MPDLQNLLDQIARLEPELATAPWFVANANEETEYMPFWQVMNHAYLNDPGTEDDVSCDVEMYVGSKADAEFIALARTALPEPESVWQNCTFDEVKNSDIKVRVEYDERAIEGAVFWHDSESFSIRVGPPQ